MISAFGEYFIKTGIFSREMGRELNRAFEKRQIGDYEYTFVFSKEDAEGLLKTGKTLCVVSTKSQKYQFGFHFMTS